MNPLSFQLIPRGIPGATQMQEMIETIPAAFLTSLSPRSYDKEVRKAAGIGIESGRDELVGFRNKYEIGCGVLVWNS